ncbi:hypothetical protein PTSG_02560 [Salpingoeca rosetta]|uniref:Uncharacterized protein n=1 Tax=Salpingoeca rosetta (strain ATCC 50818 / BSB-021) TaxID=946362 RepID=F2U2J3_SALR5|nr:uncharacterized protein PTSG_02560 [Salpingoeca rosetta]EGD81845.1 hypothetical protein PTSG_02560 [Salpingoeca rosetta]|eukprot:XP_004997049.1 hypothetical protein PTSG_02560 [Salpingoeca rosetta]
MPTTNTVSQPTVWQQHPRCTRQGHWQLLLGIGGVVTSTGLIYGIPPFDATPTTSVLIINPSTTATAMTAAVTAAVDYTTARRLSHVGTADGGVLAHNTLPCGCDLIAARAHQAPPCLVGCDTADASGSAAWLRTMAFSCHGISCNSPSILIVDPAASAVDTAMLSVPRSGTVVSAGWQRLAVMSSSLIRGPDTATRSVRTNRNILVTFRSVHASRSLLALMPCGTISPSCTTAGTLCWCARAGGLAKSAWAVRGKVGYDPSCKQAEEEFNKYTYTELALETKFGLIVEGFGYHPFRSWLRVPSPSLSSITTCCPTRTCWTGRRSAFAFPEHRLLELPRILRSIPDEVVEMMQRRVVFVFEEFFKSLSTQVHTALESARINLFSGDNA